MANTPLHIPTLINRGKWTDYRDPIWGDSYNWSWNRPPQQVEWLVIHHTVTSHDATPDDIALLHKARGWGGIGYHFVITKDGMVYYVGDVGTARANVLNKNEKVIGITMVGDFTKHNPSDDQILSAHDLCQFFLDNTAVWPQLQTYEGSVVGHKELQATACPGTYWKGVPDSIFERIKNRIPYSSIEPEPDPDPDQPDCNEILAPIRKALDLPSDSSVDTIVKSISGKEGRITTLQNKLDECTGIRETLTNKVGRLEDELLEERKTIGTLQDNATRAAHEYQSTLLLKDKQLDALEEANKKLNIDLEKCKSEHPNENCSAQIITWIKGLWR